MTDPTTPRHDEPAEGPRDPAYTSPAGGSTGDAQTRANDVLESIRDAVEDLAEKAAPVVRELSVKAAEVVAVAADKAAPIVQRAGEVTADASGKLAEKSRTWAADMRDTMSGGAGGPIDPADSVGDAARHAADDAKRAAGDAGDAIHDAADDIARTDPPL
jgi:hypothetical protein